MVITLYGPITQILGSISLSFLAMDLSGPAKTCLTSHQGHHLAHSTYYHDPSDQQRKVEDEMKSLSFNTKLGFPRTSGYYKFTSEPTSQITIATPFIPNSLSPYERALISFPWPGFVHLSIRTSEPPSLRNRNLSFSGLSFHPFILQHHGFQISMNSIFSRHGLMEGRQTSDSP